MKSCTEAVVRFNLIYKMLPIMSPSFLLLITELSIAPTMMKISCIITKDIFSSCLSHNILFYPVFYNLYKHPTINSLPQLFEPGAARSLLSYTKDASNLRRTVFFYLYKQKMLQGAITVRRP